MRKETATLALLAAGAFTLALTASPVRAQDQGTPYISDETVSVSAPRLPAVTGTRLGSGKVFLSVKVSYSDLDLATAYGKYTLRHRVRVAAAAVCGRLEAMYLPLEGDTQVCYREAAVNGLRDADIAVFSRRSFASNN